MGGLASLRAISVDLSCAAAHEWPAVGRPLLESGLLGLLAPPLPPQPHDHLADETYAVDDGGHDVLEDVGADDDLAPAAEADAGRPQHIVLGADPEPVVEVVAE